MHAVEVVHDQSSQVFDFMSLTDMSCSKSGGSEVDMSLDILVDGTADRFTGFIDSFSHDHESPVDQHFLDRPAILSKHQRKQSARAAKAQASASAGSADMSVHDVHAFSNTFVGPRGSSVGNHQQNNNDNDITNRNDVEICGGFGGDGSHVRTSGKFGGVGFGGIGGMSGGVRRPAVVRYVVEGLVNNTTTNENDDDNNDDDNAARRATSPMTGEECPRPLSLLMLYLALSLRCK